MSKQPRTIHILADSDGDIISAAILDDEASFDPQAQVRLSALEGQRLAKVTLPEEVEELRSIEDFQRLSEGFCLAAGEPRLIPRGKRQARSGAKSVAAERTPASVIGGGQAKRGNKG